MSALAELDPLKDLPQPGAIIGRRFRLGHAIGQGGMSAVFLAHDSRLQRDVAFKILSPGLACSQELVTRFVNEARMLARLDCPHIVRVLDAGVTDDRSSAQLPYMVLELLHGDDLRTHLERGGIEPERVVVWIMQACEGLAAAHAEGVIHRDLKPENLFVCLLPDGTEIVKLLDFGIARSLAAPSSLTLSGAGVGSPGYMSPEQLRDSSAADERSDIWSLGVVLYELLAGVPPFTGASGFELCAQILSGRHTRLAKVRPSLPRGLGAIVDRCLAVDPKERFGSVLELALALAPHCPGIGVETAMRVRHRLLVRDGTESDPDADLPVDVEAPTIPVMANQPPSTRSRPLRAPQHLLAQLIAASVAVMLAVALHAYGPSAPLAAAEASVSRVSERVGAAARDLWRFQANEAAESSDAPPTKQSSLKGSKP